MGESKKEEKKNMKKILEREKKMGKTPNEMQRFCQLGKT